MNRNYHFGAKVVAVFAIVIVCTNLTVRSTRRKKNGKSVQNLRDMWNTNKKPMCSWRLKSREERLAWKPIFQVIMLGHFLKRIKDINP